jgi:hypothetical protein
MLLEKRE